jgi:hypothetical protein
MKCGVFIAQYELFIKDYELCVMEYWTIYDGIWTITEYVNHEKISKNLRHKIQNIQGQQNNVLQNKYDNTG